MRLFGALCAPALLACLTGCFEADPAPMVAGQPGSCEAVEVAEEVGARCNAAAAAACEAGALCVAYVGGETRCLQACSPGLCEEMCGEGACVPLEQADGTRFSADINGDRQPEEVGVCELTSGPFERCGVTDARSCRPGAICLGGRAGDADGNCIPLCDTLGTRCGSVQGAEVGCTMTLPATAGSIELHACTIPCSADSDCPLPWVCFQLPSGGLCLEP